MSVALSNRPDAESAVPRAPFDCLCRPAGVPYYLWSIGVCAVLLIVMTPTAKSSRGWPLQFCLPTLVATGAAWLWIAIVWTYGALRTMAERIQEVTKTPASSRSWLNKWISTMYSLRILCLSGTIVGASLVLLVGLPSRWLTYPYLWYESAAARALFWVLWGLATWLAGAGLVIVIGTAAIPFRLTRDHLRLALQGHATYGIKRVGNLYFRFSLIISGAASVSVLGVVVSPMRHELGLVTLYLVFSLISLSYLVVTQLVLHRALVREKARLLDRIALALESDLDGLYNDEPTGNASMKAMDERLKIRREIAALSDWPFDPSKGIRALSASVGPVLVLVAKFWDVISVAFTPHN
jgi:hypothetical protein